MVSAVSGYIKADAIQAQCQAFTGSLAAANSVEELRQAHTAFLDKLVRATFLKDENQSPRADVAGADVLLQLARVLDVCGQHRHVLQGLYSAVARADAILRAIRERNKQERVAAMEKSLNKSGALNKSLTATFNKSLNLNGTISALDHTGVAVTPEAEASWYSDLRVALTLAQDRLQTVEKAFGKVLQALFKALNTVSEANGEDFIIHPSNPSDSVGVVKLLTSGGAWQSSGQNDDVLRLRVEKLLQERQITEKSRDMDGVRMLAMQLDYNRYYSSQSMNVE